MTDDYELLEYAAVAAGIRLQKCKCGRPSPINSETGQHWNPLQDNGDALSLACSARLQLNIYRTHVSVTNMDTSTFHEDIDYNQQCVQKALRRAIVRAAADYEA